jgi:hypothetical protein
MKNISRCLMAAAAFALAAACSDDGGGNPGDPDPVIAKTATNSGDGQTAGVTETLIEDLRVIVTLSGQPVEGEDVTWAVSANGGTIAPTTATTEPTASPRGVDVGDPIGPLHCDAARRCDRITGELHGDGAGKAATNSDRGRRQPDRPDRHPSASRWSENADQFDNPVRRQTVNWSDFRYGQPVRAASATSLLGRVITPVSVLWRSDRHSGFPGERPAGVTFDATAEPIPPPLRSVQNNSFSRWIPWLEEER